MLELEWVGGVGEGGITYECMKSMYRMVMNNKFTIYISISSMDPNPYPDIFKSNSLNPTAAPKVK